MKTLLIRELPDEVHELLVSEAGRNRRSKEKQALFIIETALANRPVETCGELLTAYEDTPPPQIDEVELENALASRGRRSNRP